MMAGATTLQRTAAVPAKAPSAAKYIYVYMFMYVYRFILCGETCGRLLKACWSRIGASSQEELHALSFTGSFYARNGQPLKVHAPIRWAM